MNNGAFVTASADKNLCLWEEKKSSAACGACCSIYWKNAMKIKNYMITLMMKLKLLHKLIMSLGYSGFLTFKLGWWDLPSSHFIVCSLLVRNS